MTIKVIHGANGTVGQTAEQVIRAIAASQVAALVAADSSINALTDNSSGTAGFTIPAAVTATTASGSNLAQKAATETALGKVKNGLATLYAKANAIATLIGHPTITYDGGGTSGGDTLAAFDKTTTGATTGAAVADFEANRLAVNGQFTRLYGFTGALGVCVGLAPHELIVGQTGDPAAIAGTVGTAASPGVSKAAADAALTAWANNAAFIADRLNDILGVDGKPTVLVVG